jgi:tRNA(Ile)-lysidine synthase
MTGRPIRPLAPLDESVARTRVAVRRCLADHEPGDRVLVACSGGADSLALAAAARFESRRTGWQVGAVVVDHGMAPDSAEITAVVADRLRTLEPLRGLDPVCTVRVEVTGPGGPEAAARDARYRALDAARVDLDATVLLGHTRDDQAETVLLGLARGSGPRSLAGMRGVTGRYRRPFLGLERALTARACAALDLPVWADPANLDPHVSRVRVRHEVLPMLERELGPGVAAALARTATLLSDDADVLDTLGEQLRRRAERPDHTYDVEALASAAAALRRRAMRTAALRAGCPGSDLTFGHVEALDDLLGPWTGERAVDLPGRVVARRSHDALAFASAPAAAGPQHQH